jgi:hypothetical protein
MKKNSLLIMASMFAASLFAQTGNVGIGTPVPGSKLTVNGSFAASYKSVSSSYTLDMTDYYVAFEGSTNETLTLPAATAAYPDAGNIKGRVYYIKNTGTANLTVAANGSELIDNQTGSGVPGIGLGQGWFVMLISKGVTGATTTWEAIVVVPGTVINTIVSMSASDVYTLPSTSAFNAGTPQVIPFAATDLQVNQGSSATWNTSTNSFDINETGIYELDAFLYWNVGGNSGTSSWMGANLAILKNGTATTNAIAGSRDNVHQAILANSAYSPLSVHCIINLTAGDKLYMTLYKGFGDNATGSVRAGVPSGLAETRHFSLKKL